MEIHWKEVLRFAWFKHLYVLYIFGFVLNFQPSLPFAYEFLTVSKNLTSAAVVEDVVPIATYSAAVLLLPVLLFMEYFKFNLFIVISTLTGLVATCLSIWTNSKIEQQLAQGFYGSFSASGLSYFVCIYAHDEVQNYQQVTAWVRAAPLAARAVSALWGQLFVSQEWLDYKQLHYFDLAAFILAALLTIVLPSVKLPKEEKPEPLPSNFTSIFSNFLEIFPNKYVTKWSIWSILTFCGYNQSTVYVQTLWKHLQDTHQVSPYNGSVDGLYYLACLIATLLAAFAIFNWKFNGDLILSMTSLVQGFLLLLMSQIDNLLFNCIFYILHGFMFHFTATILCAEIAKFLRRNSFGLLFGTIGLLTMILNSVMVYVLNAAGLGEQPQTLFILYGFYHVSISVVFIVVGLSYWFAKHTYE